jgi:putative hydrolase of the HAD superfamily
MANNNKIETLFLDIGGVLLSDGWNRHARSRSVAEFALDKQEFDDRHHLVFDIYELGKLTLDDYLQYVVFYKKREFSADDFKNFMFSQSQVLDGAVDFFKEIKEQHQLKVIAVSNEPADLNDYRIKKFGLNELFDFYISSCYVHLRKPDPEIFNLACDVSQTSRQNILFIDDRLLYTEMATNLGIPSFHYRGLESAKEYFKNNF